MSSSQTQKSRTARKKPAAARRAPAPARRAPAAPSGGAGRLKSVTLTTPRGASMPAVVSETGAQSDAEQANEVRAQIRARAGAAEGDLVGISTRFVATDPKRVREEYPDAVFIRHKREKPRGRQNALQLNENMAGTIYDRRMGPLNGYQECETCELSMEKCPTHPGIIELPEEAYFINPLALKYAYQVLQSVCNSCGSLLDRELLRASNLDTLQNSELRLELISEKLSGVLCTHTQASASRLASETGRRPVVTACKVPPTFITSEARNHGQIVYTFNKELAKTGDEKGKGRKQLRANFIVMEMRQVEKVFDSIPPEDLETLGFVGGAHPRNYIQKAVYVQPPRSRLTQNNDGKVRDDPIGKLYEKILDSKAKIEQKRAELGNARRIAQRAARDALLREEQRGGAGSGFRAVRESVVQKEKELHKMRWSVRKELQKAGAAAGEAEIEADPRVAKARAALFREKVETAAEEDPEVVKIKDAIEDAAEEIRKTYSEIIYGPSTPVTSQWQFLGIKKGLQNKEGHMRGEMMSKRVGNVGRTVGSAGPEVRMMEVGVPYKFREELTVPETVFDANLEHAKGLVLSGECVRVDYNRRGVSISAKVSETNMVSIAGRIRLGDTVHRRIRSGDYLMVNRQPTIHKQSIYLARARLTTLDTFQISLPQAEGLKGDFDGDEYNIHVVQSVEARALSVTLQNSYACLANEQNNSTMMFPTFEAPLQAYKLTRRANLLPEATWRRLAGYITPRFDEADLNKRLAHHRVPRFSGAALVSAMLPRDFDFVRSDPRDPENTVDIAMGVLRAGYLNKGMLGPGSSITNAIRLEYGPARAAHFIDSAELVLQYYGIVDPTSLGIDDCYYDIESVRDLKKRKIKEAEIIQSSAQAAQIPVEHEIQEKEMVATTDNIKAEGSKKMVEAIPDDNTFIFIEKSGAKGNRNNVYQTLVSAGQQFYRGQRMPLDYSYNSRSLATFIEGDTRLTARGLCVNSFSEGLTAQELFFLQKAGRKNLTDTSQTTSIPGTIRRQLTNMLSDLAVAYDGSVRTSAGEIVQLSYNGDGFDPGKLYKRTFTGFQAPYFTATLATARKLNRTHEYAAAEGAS